MLTNLSKEVTCFIGVAAIVLAISIALYLAEVTIITVAVAALIALSGCFLVVFCGLIAVCVACLWHNVSNP